MAATINRQRILSQLFASPLAELLEPEPLPVLEQFVFALCRENSTDEQARQAYDNLRTKFFDWNEIRVSSIREIEDAMTGLGETESRAQRLVSFLQEVFEDRYSFDLEELHKKGLKQASKRLMTFGAANDYSGSWVVQRSLGGHAIPIDGPTLRCLKRIGMVEQGNEDIEAARASLEHLVPKSKGPQFTDAISNLAERHCWEDEPQCHGCPLNGECQHAQENIGDQLATARTARAKPR